MTTMATTGTVAVERGRLDRNILEDIIRRLVGNMMPPPDDEGQYMQGLLATEITYHPYVIEALKTFKGNHKIGNESDETRLQGLKVLLDEIARSHNITPPALSMVNIDGGHSGGSYYDELSNSIVMTGKLSIITFLHEIAHAVYGHDEQMARAWSIKLFKKVYPKAFARLKVSNGFVLTMQDNTVAIPVVASGSGGE
jgi:hypothetical protein